MSDKKSEHFIFQELDHYRVGLRARAAAHPVAGHLDDDTHHGITFEYLGSVPSDLLKTLGFATDHTIDEHTSCLIARHEGVPIGCKFFNLQGKVKHHYPFHHEMAFPPKHVYGFGFFLKQEFRGKGIGKLIHLESERILRDTFDDMDILVEQGNYIAIRNAEGLGFEKNKTFVFLEFLNLHLFLSVIPGFPYRFYKAVLQLIKLGWKFISGLPQVLMAVFRWAYGIKEDLLLTSYTLQSAAPDENLTGIFICRHKPDPTFVGKLFPGGYETRKNKIFPRGQLLHEFKNVPKQMDFIIADVRPRHVRRHLDRFTGAFIIPKWIDQINPNFEGFSEFTRQKNRNVYNDIQSVKKHNYTYEFSRDEVLLKFFYEKMYCPYMHNRYPEEKIITPFASVQRDFQRGGLLLLKEKDTRKYLAASIVYIRKGVLHVVKLGLLNGDAGLLKKRVLAALYLSYFEFMVERGLRSVHFGASRAFLNDGVLKYKSKWNTQLEFKETRSNIFIFKIHRPSERMNTFLIENPFISLEGRELTGNIFIADHDTSPEEELIKDYKFKGLSKFRVSRITTTAPVHAGGVQGQTPQNHCTLPECTQASQ